MGIYAHLREGLRRGSNGSSRPTCRDQRALLQSGSIEAHPTIVFAASPSPDSLTIVLRAAASSIHKFTRTARPQKPASGCAPWTTTLAVSRAPLCTDTKDTPAWLRPRRSGRSRTRPHPGPDALHRRRPAPGSPRQAGDSPTRCRPRRSRPPGQRHRRSRKVQTRAGLSFDDQAWCENRKITTRVVPAPTSPAACRRSSAPTHRDFAAPGPPPGRRAPNSHHAPRQRGTRAE
jgi:hypothetical protein